MQGNLCYAFMIAHRLCMCHAALCICIFSRHKQEMQHNCIVPGPLYDLDVDNLSPLDWRKRKWSAPLEASATGCMVPSFQAALSSSRL